ncbi:hypothetical protein BLA6992_05400 [Burkholderia lata]|uniref:Uncharacterized protein n=1 Tax=Burkholderia lata (strain ATCC 17760 / DSM 23089 / LMG 22485 / NCIMB 9086 / R18194 / 383) TaxID=482957 RepID=A0A6P2KTY0_BURL3|nr:hypothetical protein BLA6863_02691 [Burkholderia lata]VWM14891.1 hypothetical protein BLA6992_05400 [Burkholderia lata]
MRRLVTAGAYCMVCKGPLHTVKMCNTARRLAAKASFHLARTFMRTTGKEVDFYSSAIIRHTAQVMRLIKPGVDVDRCSTKPQCDEKPLDTFRALSSQHVRLPFVSFGKATDRRTIEIGIFELKVYRPIGHPCELIAGHLGRISFKRNIKRMDWGAGECPGREECQRNTCRSFYHIDFPLDPIRFNKDRPVTPPLTLIDNIPGNAIRIIDC